VIKAMLALILLANIFSCGQKSEVSTDIRSESLAEKYGDGEYLIRPFYLPLSDKVISTYDSPVDKVGFIVGGFARVFMDLGAYMGMGQTQLALIQPVHPIMSNDIIKGVKIKRLFFYLEPKENQHRWKSIMWRLARGQGDVTFGFLDQMALKISSTHEEQITSWFPKFEFQNYEKKDFELMKTLFEEPTIKGNVKVQDGADSLMILKYERSNKKKYLRNSKIGKMFIIHTEKPGLTKKHLLSSTKFRGLIKKVHMVDHTLLVELYNVPLAEKDFRVSFLDDNTLINSYKVSLVEECSEQTCLDLEVTESDLISLINKGNALKINAYIDASRAPDSFQLKGFAEFEVKLKMSF